MHAPRPKDSARNAWLKKAGLVLVGLCLSVVLLELGLRAGGFVFLLRQKARNQESLGAADNELRILCLGESTTALGGKDAYPRQLERLLRTRLPGRPVRVFNKGVPGTNTHRILQALDEQLNEYDPQIVVTMMGINDKHGLARPITTKRLSWFSRLRVGKLATYIGLRLSAGAEPSSEPKRDANEKIPGYEDAKALADADRIDEAIEAFQALAEQYPGHPKINHRLAVLRVRAHRRPELERLEEALHDVDSVLIEGHLGPRVGDDGRLDRELAHCLVGEKGEAIDLAAKLRRAGRKHEAVAVLASVTNGLTPGHPDRLWVLSELSRCLDTGVVSPELAALAQKVREPNPATIRNYTTLCRRVLDRGMVVVCVQYPMRPLSELMAWVGDGESRAVFVDNEASFKAAVGTRGFDALFTDVFAGDFGHCTAEGNRLLAENVADAIVATVAGKSGRDLDCKDR